MQLTTCIKLFYYRHVVHVLVFFPIKTAILNNVCVGRKIQFQTLSFVEKNMDD